MRKKKKDNESTYRGRRKPHPFWKSPTSNHNKIRSAEHIQQCSNGAQTHQIARKLIARAHKSTDSTNRQRNRPGAQRTHHVSLSSPTGRRRASADGVLTRWQRHLAIESINRFLDVTTQGSREAIALPSTERNGNISLNRRPSSSTSTLRIQTCLKDLARYGEKAGERERYE